MEKSISDNLAKHVELSNDKFQKYYNWLRGLIAIAGGLVAILISLKSGISKNPNQHKLFISTIGLLSAGILFGSIVLYQEVYIAGKYLQVMHDHIKEQFEGYKGDLLGWIEIPKIYKICSYLCIISFVLSLISLVTYAVFADLP